MEYDSHTLLELKTMCKERGLRVSGSKAEVVIRLMEDDESKSPQPVSIPVQQNVQYGQQQMYGGQPQQIFITNNTTSVVQLTGFGIIFYGFFRVSVGVLFSEWQAEESFFALVIGIAYIFGGVLSVQGYRLGLQMTIITLVISGLLSLAYHDEVSPLSVGMGGFWPIELSLICSGFCILIVAMPLLTADPSNFKTGSPNYLKTVIDMADTVSPIPLIWGSEKKEGVDAKIVVNCAHCNSPLKVPTGYTGNVKCPSCGEKFEVK
mgnify:FL=1|jgi:hypothetical protein